VQYGGLLACDVAQHTFLAGLSQRHWRPPDLSLPGADGGPKLLGKNPSTQADGQRRSVGRDASSKDGDLVGDKRIVLSS
jgi:hypothetical protein